MLPKEAITSELVMCCFSPEIHIKSRMYSSVFFALGSHGTLCETDA